MTDRVKIGGLDVERVLYDFIEHEALPGTGIESRTLWSGMESLLADFSPRNRELLSVRNELQRCINAWHAAHPGPDYDRRAYKSHLRDIGYLLDAPADFTIDTAGVDPEIGTVAGPQLVVPVLNARFAINAANARWGSLYDALYGTDAIPTVGDITRGAAYNPIRGEAVISAARGFLDTAVPLEAGSHAAATSYAVVDGRLTVTMSDGATARLGDQRQLLGYRGEVNDLSAIVLVNNGLHIVIEINRDGVIGRTDPAGVNDVLLESALTTIVDFEDSVAAVDAADKVLGYRNWLGLMKGDLTAAVRKGGSSFTRGLNPDQTYRTLGGAIGVLRGRSMLLVRNVGHLMTTDAVLDNCGNEAPEGVLDAVVTVLAAKHSLTGHTNSRHGSVYVVKPKMHGPDEVAFAVALFDRVEQLLSLEPDTVKLGIMDEERRTSVNLKASIREARSRVVFINTGFLDRTGDEIHTSMAAGPVVPKRRMREQKWFMSYEQFNVDTGLAAGLGGRAQIGKGMWTMPDRMADMLEQKVSHLQEGASTAWVPSPTAATLHTLHYHQVDVFRRQQQLLARRRVSIDDILEIPLAVSRNWTDDQKRRELDDNAQSILGYVVRWIKQGVGCSKVPDLDNIALMEDRATLRISSQFVANWLRHGVVTDAQVRRCLERMAVVVDQQNSVDPDYEPMAPHFDTDIAFQAACELVFAGATQPSGYTEPILHRRRRQFKSAQNRP